MQPAAARARRDGSRPRRALLHAALATSASLSAASDWDTRPVTTTPSLLFDCRLGYESWVNGWPEVKKIWCCDNMNIGCGHPYICKTCAATYDCNVAASGLWSEEQRVYCCRNKSVGCTTSTLRPYTCHDGAVGMWSMEQTDWCCSRESVGCYDCHGGHQGTWSKKQRDYCCTKESIGCPPPAEEPSPAYSCHDGSLELWSEAKLSWCCRAESIGCSTATTPTPVPLGTTSPVLTPEVLTCDLNCFGPGAQPVALPGSAGTGDNQAVQDLTFEECKAACRKTQGCEAVVNKKSGPGICYGKKDVRTSLCQPGGSFHTVIFGALPWGKCVLMGDPHILTFDRVYGPMVNDYDPGDFVLIKSDHLAVHGRFGYTERFPDDTSTVGIAVGGSYAQGHTLVAVYVGPERGSKGFKVWWDNTQILMKATEDAYASDDNFFTAKLADMDPSHFHRDSRHTIGGVSGLLPSYLFKLGPDLSIYVLIGPDNCNLVIEAKKRPGDQDGFCGNFNCDQDDDSKDALWKRGWFRPLPENESIFARSPAPPPDRKKKQPTKSPLDNCDPTLKQKALQACASLPKQDQEACVFDACAAGAVDVAAADLATIAADQASDVQQKFVQTLRSQAQPNPRRPTWIASVPSIQVLALVAAAGCLSLLVLQPVRARVSPYTPVPTAEDESLLANA
mmetsp:Transcript_45663/g.141549  ORF Transcript_45663/g.141549 Transcript_45663/m.141549 type:complete len:676 (+) Transcript_45663:113-2140(+)